MNHFMLPQHKSGAWGNDLKSTRFGNFAMEKLINELIKAGCARERMEIKVFGGGNVTESSNAVGSDNAEFVLQYLQAEGLSVCRQRPRRNAATPNSILPVNRTRGTPIARRRRAVRSRSRGGRLRETAAKATACGRC